MEPRSNEDTFTTYSGVLFNYDAPTLDMIRLPDIVQSLSHQARFFGHTEKFYSVLQHSALVGALVLERIAHRLPLNHAGTAYEPVPSYPDHVLQRCGMLHDAAEAYVGDAITPRKRRLQPAFGKDEARIEALIEERFQLYLLFDPIVQRMIKQLDRLALELERLCVVPKRNHNLFTWTLNPDQYQSVLALKGLALCTPERALSPSQAREMFLQMWGATEEPCKAPR